MLTGIATHEEQLTVMKISDIESLKSTSMVYLSSSKRTPEFSVAVETKTKYYYHN